jgi:Uma2 family endonuclease
MATVTVRVGPADHGRRMSLEEFLDCDVEPGFRYELARGVLEVTEVPGEPHGLIVHFLYKLLAVYEREHPDTIYRFGGAGESQLVVPTMASGRNPDIAIVLHGARRDERGGRPPAIAFEIVSAGNEAHTRDYVTKRDEYLEYGLAEYWIVDRFARRVLVLNRDDANWTERKFEGDQVATSRVLSGFAVRVGDFWAVAEA